jgi:hypothetical protein
MNADVLKKFLYPPTLCMALALIAISPCLAIGTEERPEQNTRKVIVFRVTQKIKNGPVMAEYQIAITKGEMALSTVILDDAACAQSKDREDDYLNIYWKDGQAFEWKPGAIEGISYQCDEAQMARYLVFWINRGGLYNYPLKYFAGGQPDGTYNLDLPDSDPLKEDFPNVKVTVAAGKIWVSEATIVSKKLPNQPIVTTRALPKVIDNFQIPTVPDSIRFQPAENPLAHRIR